MPQSDSARSSQSFDHHIAERIRTRRMMLGISQETLGKHLGVTFQQIQKYEKGTNRVSGGRLWEITKLFETPIDWFFDEMPGAKVVENGASRAANDILRDAATVRVAKAFGKIRDARVRDRIAKLIEALANSEDATS
ncbi:MAG TPA: helix-turn-helix transcriptional regulator [Acidobacteriaceae bacterium]